MNVLVIGSGGREHAIAWKIKQSPLCQDLFCLPGNPGTASFAHNISSSILDFEQIKNIVIDNKIDLVVCGPEEPLVKGIRDYFESTPDLKKVLFVGPGKEGAALEGSKEYAKMFMSRHNIPTASFASFSKNQIGQARSFLSTLDPPYVLKADGLAAGKGVLILDSLEEAYIELESIFSGKFGSAGDKVVIEQFLSGIELSVFILTDGDDYLLLPCAKDYKRIGEGDIGLNTGGMGAVSPVPFVDQTFLNKIKDRIVSPTLKGLRDESIKYKGFIFFGLINCNGDPYVIEYNVRMGDPETEAVIPRIKSDLLQHLIACAEGTISKEKIDISPNNSFTVVCVSAGYPQDYKKGEEIVGENLITPTQFDYLVKIFHCGTKMTDNKLVTNGGRVLAVNASSLQEVYRQIDLIHFNGKYYRKDIGKDLTS